MDTRAVWKGGAEWRDFGLLFRPFPFSLRMHGGCEPDYVRSGSRRIGP